MPQFVLLLLGALLVPQDTTLGRRSDTREAVVVRATRTSGVAPPSQSAHDRGTPRIPRNWRSPSPRVARLSDPVATVVADPAPPEVSWLTGVSLYGDNTEFFTPYREGETIFGGQFVSQLIARPSPRFAFYAGVFGDVRWGSTEFLDRVKPVLSARYRTATSLGVIGTLETERRHGLIEPLAVTTLELTRPIEYGLQWRERRRWWDGEVFVNWQALNTRTQREVIDYGWRLRVRPIRQVSMISQLHGLHHGGQLFNADVPVTNNIASGLGIEVADSIRGLGLVSATVYRMRSRGNIDPAAPAERPTKGRGTYLRAAVAPRPGLEVFGLHWWGRDFLSQEGDNNYNSAGYRTDVYRSRRRYFEMGLARRSRLEGNVEFDAEFRLHRVDGLKSEALLGTSWEYSYRLVVRSPFEFPIR